jgi:hypothetical protein
VNTPADAVRTVGLTLMALTTTGDIVRCRCVSSCVTVTRASRDRSAEPLGLSLR